MTKLLYIYIFVLLCSFSFAEIEEVEQYNFEIKSMMTTEYSEENKNNQVNRREGSHHNKWENFVDSVEDYFDEKEEQYKEYKAQLERRLSENLNSRIVPQSLDSNLDVIVQLDENPDDIKLKYRYTPELIKASYIDLGLDEQELKIAYVYVKPIDGLGGYFFNSVGYLFDKSIKNILEITKMKVR